MPEAAVDEDGDPSTPQDDVRPSRQAGTVKAKAETLAM
jgi:hypothetical protein